VRAVQLFEKARMAEVSFWTDSASRMACGRAQNPIKIDSPSGSVSIVQETRFSLGTLFMALDLAKKLSVSKERMTDA
jgi:hypothetical protein